MEIRKVAPKEIYVTIELPLTEIDMVLEFLSHAEMRGNFQENPELGKAASFVREDFFPQLERLTEDLKRNVS